MSQGTARILLVEDDPSQREVLRYNLVAQDYSVTEAESGDEALLLVEETLPDLILLDWMLPGVSGIEICRQIKTRKSTRNIPVIMLSARSEEVDKVRGLETGADDYVAKPYSVAELLARVRTQLRRTRPSATGQILEFEDIHLDAESHKVTRSGHPVALGPTEYRLLVTLMERQGRVWSRSQLLDRVWDQNADLETRTVDVHVGRLRKALCKNIKTDPIRTVRGSGYALG